VALQAFDEGLSSGAENVVVRHQPTLLRLDPLRTEPVQAAPFLELRTEANHVEKRLLSCESADGRPVVGVEVAMDGDAARFRELDRLFDFSPLKVLFAQKLIVRRCRR
jgi:hypothetical protein